MNNKEFIKGLLLNASLSLIFLSVFYGNLFSVFNKVYFSPGGDGLQMYINMMYHIKFDSTYMQCNTMNYPYGEHVFFSNNQPLISNTIKFLAKQGIDLSTYTIGIVNFLMVFSIFAASLLLYLIFVELGVGWVIGAIASVGIAFLSPQLDRFGGHFNLSYVCSIPWFIYLVMRFFRTPNWWWSVLISLTAIAAALTHFYLYGFLAIIAIFFYTGYGFFQKDYWKPQWVWILHFFIQIILPFIILQSMYFADNVTDRPAYPWGFLELRAYPQGVFLPLFTSYGHFLRKFVPTGYVEWEGIAFVGLVASVFSFFLFYKFFYYLFGKKYRQILKVTSDFRLNTLFWASVAALLYSFGIPFVLGLQDLVDYIGPFRQMRGIGRFAWLFYFVINIVVFYWLWSNWKDKVKKSFPTILIVITLSTLYIDAYLWARNRGKNLENYIPELQDIGNKTPNNQWINRINVNDFQAILPLPYFHVGSENIWIEGRCGIVNKALITGYQTGLPSMAVLLSRTSISQTLSNLSIMLEPSQNGLKSMRFQSSKPLLIIAAKCELSINEKRLIKEATLLESSNEFDYYSLPINAFSNVYNSLSTEAFNEFSAGYLIKHDDYYTNDSLNRIVHVSYDSIPNEKALFGRGCYQGVAKYYNSIFNSTFPNADTSITYTCSVWVGGFSRDLCPRTNIILSETNAEGKEVAYKNFQIFHNIAVIDGDWALIEWNYKLQNPKNKLNISLRNKLLHRKPMIVDELIIKPTTSNVYKVDGNGIWKNNRIYKKVD